MKGENKCGAHVAVLGIKRLPAFAGADRVVEHLLDSASQNTRYTVYLIRDGSAASACTSRIHYVYIPALKGKYLRAPSYFFLCCAHYLVKGHYDVAHVHNSDFGLFCMLLKAKRGVRIVGTFHGDPARRDKWKWLAKVILRASEVVFVRLCDELTSVSAEKVVKGRAIQYIPNGIERPVSLVTDEEEAFPFTELGVREGEYVMFACGRLDRTKGLHHLLAAYREMHSDARLLIIGDFSHDRKYSDAITRAVAGDKRVFLHKTLLDRRKLTDVLRSCAVFVFPSEVEAMSMMLLEAIASGAVVVCSDIAANAAVVGSGYPYIFRSGDSESLRAVLEEALSVSHDDAGIQRAREHVASIFCWEKIALAYEALYEGRAITDHVWQATGDSGRTLLHSYDSASRY
jgi:glycosyltransferase involved in cell wall biosynthesis